jgi:hypothetical protein
VGSTTNTFGERRKPTSQISGSHNTRIDVVEDALRSKNLNGDRS